MPALYRPGEHEPTPVQRSGLDQEVGGFVEAPVRAEIHERPDCRGRQQPATIGNAIRVRGETVVEWACNCQAPVAGRGSEDYRRLVARARKGQLPRAAFELVLQETADARRRGHGGFDAAGVGKGGRQFRCGGHRGADLYIPGKSLGRASS